MILQYHLTHGHARNALLDPVNQKIYFIPKEIDTLEEVIAEHTEYPEQEYQPISMDHFSHSWLEMLEMDLNFEHLEQVYQFASDCLCSYLMIRVHTQENLERLTADIAERKQAGFFSLHQLYVVTTFEANLDPIPPDPNHFFKILNFTQVMDNRKIHATGFRVLQDLIVQAHHGNLFYGRRLYLDQEGYLKPHAESDYQGAPLSRFMGQPEAIQKDTALTRLWSIAKDEVQVCRDCEFRHVCIDPSDLLLQEDGSYLRADPCGYNPFKGTWDSAKNIQTEPSHLG